MATKENKYKWLPFIVFAFIIISLLYRVWQVSSVPLHDWDESIYARVAWESLQNKSLEMTYNGNLWVEKPPFVVYVLALVMAVFGQSELWLRGVSLLFGIPLLIVLYLLAKKLVYGMIERHKWKISAIDIEVISLLPVFTLLSAPLFIDRLTLVNYDIPLALGWTLFFLADSYKLRLIALIIAVTSKSLLGFFPVVFDVFKIEHWNLFKKKNFWRNIFSFHNIKTYTALIAIPLIWHIVSIVIYGNDFIQQHIFDHLISRVTTPIELHFGGRLFYVKQFYLEYDFFALLFIAGYALWLWDAAQVMIRKRKLPAYSFMIFSAPLVYITFLTFSKTKIWWYLLSILPLMGLIISYLATRLPSSAARYILAFFVFGFFLFRFLPHTLLFTPGKDIPDKTSLAACVRNLEGSSVAFLVDEAERNVKHVFEAANIGIGSSFIYGGSPAFVYYSNKKITFFYDTSTFLKEYSKYPIAVITANDITELQFSGTPLCSEGEWKAITRK